MIVYRVERPDGRGPYEVDVLSGWYNLDRHPTPIADGITFSRLQFFFEIRYGFASIASLRRWFDWLTIERLQYHDFRIAAYRVRDKRYVVHGKHQVAFDKARAQRIHMESLAPLTRMAA